MGRHLHRLLVLCLAVAAGFLHQATRRLEAAVDAPSPVALAPRWNEGMSKVPAFVADTVPLDVPLEVSSQLRRGENLGSVLQRLGLDADESARVSEAAARHLDLRRLRAGERYAAFYTTDGLFTALALDVAGQGRLHLRREAGGWSADWRVFEKRTEIRSAAGVVHGSLEAAISGAGAAPEVAYRMADVLEWDVDFNRDLRRGDRFTVVYEELWADDEPHRIGPVLACVFENQGRRLEAYRYGDGYYDADGRPLRKLFLRSPLKYSRISSRFSQRRLHPVLETHRPHYGVDYAAPTGTPVRATAGGVVLAAGWSGGGGKTVKVRHPNGYVTAYLHLSGYAEGVRPGRRVRQGEIIGYVGATGLATGPHLDYRIQHRGRWIDPLTLENEPAPSLSSEEVAPFLAHRDTLRLALADVRRLESDGMLLASSVQAAAAGGR